MTKGLFSKKRRDILINLENGSKRFVELKCILSSESNILSYNLKILIEEGFVEKRNNKFHLTMTAENIMPYVHKEYDAKQIPLPVVATIVINKDKILIRKKHSTPEKDKGIFIGGKIGRGEDIIECAKKKVLDKTGIRIKNTKIICINNYVSTNSHYIVFFVRAEGKGKPKNSEWMAMKDIDFEMFPDNKYILEKMLNNKHVKIIQSNYDEKTKEFLVNIS